ncbi:hypothetical protein CYMTET_8347, partial [Cymbomonas tetramitiformis]
QSANSRCGAEGALQSANSRCGAEVALQGANSRCGAEGALQGANSRCGAEGALQSANSRWDRLIVHQYDRMTPLQIAPRPVETYRDVRPGDCIVAFARRDIFNIKKEIEFYTDNKCSIVYGKLPPETRRQQAKMFNEVDSGVDVLVASDAVGMGLNLNIGRVIFHSMDKYNGLGFETVPPTQIKQIAGRAGRHGTLYAEGWATCRNPEDMAVLIEGLSAPPEPTKAAGLFPTVEQMTAFALTMPDVPLATILDRFMRAAKLDGNFFLCRYEDMLAMANALHDIEGLSLRERFMFMAAPVSTADSVVMSSLLEYAVQYAKGESVQLVMDTKMQLPKDDKSLKEMEDMHRIFALYQWLSVPLEPRPCEGIQLGENLLRSDERRAHSAYGHVTGATFSGARGHSHSTSAASSEARGHGHSAGAAPGEAHGHSHCASAALSEACGHIGVAPSEVRGHCPSTSAAPGEARGGSRGIGAAPGEARGGSRGTGAAPSEARGGNRGTGAAPSEARGHIGVAPSKARGRTGAAPSEACGHIGAALSDARGHSHSIGAAPSEARGHIGAALSEARGHRHGAGAAPSEARNHIGVAPSEVRGHCPSTSAAPEQKPKFKM